MSHRRGSAAASAALAVVFCWAGITDADEYADFRIPEHAVVFATGTFSTSGSRFVTSAPEFASTDLRHSGLLGAAYSRRFEADAHAWSTSFSGGASGTRQRTAAEPAVFDDRTLARSADAGERFRVAAGYARFLGPHDVRVSLDGSVDAAYRQFWTSAWQEDQQDSVLVRQESDLQAWLYSPSYRISVGTGIGRLRDVTGLYQTLLLERRLVAAGVLVRPLSGAARQRLAELVYLRGAAGSVRERPARGTWHEVERILRDDGALADDPMPAEAALEAIEPVLGATSSISRDALSSDLFRERGTALVVSLAGVETRETQRRDEHYLNRATAPGLPDVISEFRDSQHSKIVTDRYPLEVRILHSHPVGLHRVWSGSLGFSRELRTGRQHSAASGGASTTWILVDRWVADVAANWTRDWPSDSDAFPGSAWGFGLDSSLRYHIEDHVALSLTVSHVQYRSGTDYRRSEGYSAGITYRFAGRLIAPAFPGLAHTGAGYASQ